MTHVGDAEAKAPMPALPVNGPDATRVLQDHPGDGVSYEDWVLGLGRPRHVATWDVEAGRCGTSDICPECVRASQGAAA